MVAHSPSNGKSFSSNPKRVFDFFRDELHADEDVKDQHHHRQLHHANVATKPMGKVTT